MADTPILCPYCGEEMALTHDKAQDMQVAYYWCRECGASAPSCRQWPNVTNEELNERAARFARARYTPPQEPIPVEAIEHMKMVLPCWIDLADRIYPDVLDRDVEGYYGQSDNYMCSHIHYRHLADYGKTWRCWATHPSDEERRNAPWCSTTSAPTAP